MYFYVDANMYWLKCDFNFSPTLAGQNYEILVKYISSLSSLLGRFEINFRYLTNSSCWFFLLVKPFQAKATELFCQKCLQDLGWWPSMNYEVEMPCICQQNPTIIPASQCEIALPQAHYFPYQCIFANNSQMDFSLLVSFT